MEQSWPARAARRVRAVRRLIPFVPQRRGWTAEELASPWTDVTRRRRVVAFEWSTERTASITADDRFRAMRVIRDPRDQLISSTHYHAKAGESWLHVPKAAFDGRTYQETLCARPTLREQLRFEMGESSRRVIGRMSAFDDSAPNLRTVRYEDLMTGGPTEFRSLFEFLGFAGGALEVALGAAAEASIASNPEMSRRTQVRSGAVEQWREVFDQELAETFLAVHPTALGELGYEDNDDWVATLPRSRPELDATATTTSRTMEVPA